MAPLPPGLVRMGLEQAQRRTSTPGLPATALEHQVVTVGVSKGSQVLGHTRHSIPTLPHPSGDSEVRHGLARCAGHRRLGQEPMTPGATWKASRNHSLLDLMVAARSFLLLAQAVIRHSTPRSRTYDTR